jgi:hypothetical protein
LEHSPGLSPAGVGGWKSAPPDLCRTRARMGSSSSDLTLPTLECLTGAGRAACTGGSVLFSDGFEADPVGAAPRASPAGIPADDRVTSSGSVAVVSLSSFGGKASRVARAVTLTRMEAIFGRGAQSSGSYCLSFRGVTETGNAAFTISPVSAGGKAAWRLHISAGGASLVSGQGEQTIRGSLALAGPLRIRSEMDLGRFNLAVEGTTVATSLPFLDSDFTTPERVRFAYGPMLLEGYQARYVVDDVVGRRAN